MSKIMFSGIGITAQRGKLGADVFTANRGGACIRSYVVPANTITAYRTAARNHFSTAVSLWSLTTADERAQWELFAQRLPRRNKVGQRYVLAARNAFIQCNYNLLCSGQLPISAPNFNAIVDKLSRVQISTCSAITITASFMFAFNGSSISADDVLIVSFSPCVSSGITYPRNNFIACAFLTSATNPSAFNFLPSYSAVFGVPVAGQQIFLRAVLVNSLCGLKCVPFTTRTLVS